MFASLRLRSEVAWLETCDAFLDHCSLLQFALLFPAEFEEPYIMAERPMTAPDQSLYQSTASAPSLRRKESMEIMDRPRSSDGDANVKVVVRVRKFIKRGVYAVAASYKKARLLMLPSRHRETVQMHRPNGPRNTRDQTPPPRNSTRRPQAQQKSLRRKIIHIR